MSAPVAVVPALVPPLTPARRPAKLTVAERVLPTGLRVLVVRRATVPLVEVRLRVPFAGRSASHSAKASVLGETLLSGTADLTTVDIAVALQEIGGSLSVSADPDRLLLSGNGLASGLPRLLEILADVLTGAAYPAEEVTGERDRLVERLRMARSQPGVIAREALLGRMYGDHPYAHEIPEADAVAAVTPAQLRSLHRSRVIPAGSTLVIVGDVSPQRALDRVETALADWDGGTAARGAPRLPALEAGPIVLVDRPGAVQSNIRVGGHALSRQDPQYPAMQLANLVYGGYFSSRLVENVREEKGYSYSPHSVIEHSAAGSALVMEADVATEVTAPALLEMRYELGRMATLPVAAQELDSARQYAIGTLALSIATQAGLASTITALLASGVDVDWLREHTTRLGAVTIADVQEQAARHLAPSALATVVVGDAAAVGFPLSTLDEVSTG
ncbi:MAG: insulinase family protein [Pseudonocardiales bacterium]|nr:MAG: insulinase family protein [Pseudonocardiales bacterium]